MPRLLGIRYATATRFERPRSHDFDAEAHYDSFGPAAPQRADAALVPGMAISETDEHACLTLNVWTPALDGSRPVLVWFPGGQFARGSSSQPMYDGARLSAEQDVVVVTVNYRLGALGFMDTRSLGGDVANLGLHDAFAALQWVQAHIAQLGGDPERVTIFGESAGGGVCIHLLASARARGLFRGVIAQSGVTDFTLEPDRAAIVARALADDLGVTDLDALRRLPVDAILDAQERVMLALLPTIGMMPFHPSIDGEVLLAAPAAAGTGGIPLVAGTTAEEMNLYVDPGAAAPARDKLVRRIARLAGIEAKAAARAVDAYEADLGDIDKVFPTVFTDVMMHGPLKKVLDAHTPSYTYSFDWRAPRLGAFHAVDIPFTFDSFDVDGWGEFVGADDDAFRIGRELRDAWGAFAHTGKPGWPAYPAAHVFARESHDATAHPGLRRLEHLAGGPAEHALDHG
jgi:para-nitrobenzyl esterase